MGGDPKQFRLLGDAPVLVQTVRAFAQMDEIGAIVIAVAEDEINSVEALCVEFALKVEVVKGGAARQDSVGEGLKALGNSLDIVLVHDAVRPFITSDQIRRVIGTIREHGAAAVAVPVADTLRQSSDGRFGETVERNGLFRMLTPQGAKKELLIRAHAEAEKKGLGATDEVELLQRVGVEVHLVSGDERNIKLTRPSDWSLAEALWPAFDMTEG